MTKPSNEEVAHGLALAVVTAKLSKQSNPKADISVIREYDNAYRQLLSLVERTR